MGSNPPSKRLGAVGILIHLAAYVALWIAFSGDAYSSWLIGVPAVLLALWATVQLAPLQVPRFNPFYFVLFLPVFLRLSVSGGLDVARRAMGRRVRLSPALMDYPLRLPPGTPRFFFVLLISLLPGTLSADLHGDRLVVHVLDRGQDNQATLARLEEQVARLFGEPLADQEAPGA